MNKALGYCAAVGLLLGSWGLAATEEEDPRFNAVEPDSEEMASPAPEEAVEMTDVPVTAPLDGGPPVPDTSARAAAPRAPKDPKVAVAGRAPVVKVIFSSTLTADIESGLILRGDHFRAGMKVLLGTKECRDLTVHSPRKLSCIAPAQPAGTYPLSIQAGPNAEDPKQILPQSITYAPAYELGASFASTEGASRKVVGIKGQTPSGLWFSGKGKTDWSKGTLSPEGGIGIRQMVTADGLGESESALEVYSAPRLISPKKSVAPNNKLSLTVAGGGAPFRFSIASDSGKGSLVHERTGLFAAGNPGEVLVRVTDAAGSVSETKIMITTELKVTSPDTGTSCERAVVIGDTIKLQATGGIPPYRFALVAGDGTLESDGTFQAPTTTGMTMVRVFDSEGNESDCRVNRVYPLTLVPQSRVLGFYEGKKFVAGGGMPPYRFELVSGKGTIDPVTGFFAAPDEISHSVVKVTDREGHSAEGRVNVVRFHFLPKLLAAGQFHTCAAIGSEIQCWGENRSGQLGDGTNRPSSAPVPTIPPSSLRKPVTSIVAGAQHTCALIHGAVSCWGDNTYGQVGLPPLKATNSAVPTQVPGMDEGVTDIAAGYHHTCAIKHGAVYCWGRSDKGQLGVSKGPGHVPVQVIPRGATSVSAGLAHSCAALDKTVHCWGQEASGEIKPPTPVLAVGEPIIAISSGAFQGCGVVSSGAWCWGYSGAGSLGKRTGVNYASAQPFTGLHGEVTAITSGMYHSCAVMDGRVWCWGSNGRGQTGLNSRDQMIESPKKVVNLPDSPKAITTGFDHSCALHADGVRCWGTNSHGQLGIEGTGDLRAPKKLVRLRGLKALEK